MNNSIKSICIKGFVIRILALVFILLFSSHLTEGYLRSTTISDDIRYEQGALIYSKTANNLIDPYAFMDAFQSVDDNIWLADSIQIWYWIVCILTYIFKSSIAVKIINIIFSVTCIYLLYKLAKLVYPDNKRIAIVSAKLYAYFPFPVFFCCFLYKDQFLALVLLAIFYYVYRVNTVLKPVRILIIAILLIIFSLLRSGLLPVLILCISLIELKKRNVSLKLNIKTFSIIVLTGIIALFLYNYSSDIIARKIEGYIVSRLDDQSLKGSNIQYFFINNIWDLWKLPFAYIFTLVQPLYIGGNITNWESFVSVLNVFFVPVAIGNLIYLFRRNKSNNTFWICVMLLYSVMLIVSLGIGRHFFYLLPYTMLFYSDFIIRGDKKIKMINKIIIALSLVYFIICVPSLLSIQ